jgi:hypothetical protein
MSGGAEIGPSLPAMIPELSKQPTTRCDNDWIIIDDEELYS